MRAKNKIRHKTKDKIFFASAELFANRGFSGVSMRDIAKKVGIQPSAIYNHYSSKELILEELLNHYLNRMEFFYKRLAETEIDIREQKDLPKALNKIMLAYEPDERMLMYCLTRIVYHEQFNEEKAAEALIGQGYKSYVAAHIHFFDRLADAGLINGKENNEFYGEMYARLSLTFAMQFLHPEIEPTIPEQSVLNDFVNKLVLSHEEKLANNKE